MATKQLRRKVWNASTNSYDTLHYETDVDVVVGLSQNYRQPSTDYALGNIAYHDSLPTGWYLECTTAGTTGSGDISPNASMYTTITDGTVVWALRSEQNMFVSRYSGTRISELNYAGKMGSYLYSNSASHKPDSASLQGALLTFRQDETHYEQFAINQNDIIFHRLYDSGFSAWKEMDSIVAKSLGANGYVRYSSGLILQWGNAATDSGGTKRITFPISFTVAPQMCAIHSGTAINVNMIINNRSNTYTDVLSSNTSANIVFSWFAIGY